MKPFTRADRVGALIKEVASEILHKKINDPRLYLTTITEVKVSSDLKYAKIFFSITGGTAKVTEALEGFECARGFFRRSLAGELDLRYMPEIRFIYDQSFDRGDRINRILKEIASEKQ